jgi:hypothetical protein
VLELHIARVCAAVSVNRAAALGPPAAPALAAAGARAAALAAARLLPTAALHATRQEAVMLTAAILAYSRLQARVLPLRLLCKLQRPQRLQRLPVRGRQRDSTPRGSHAPPPPTLVQPPHFSSYHGGMHSQRTLHAPEQRH